MCHHGLMAGEFLITLATPAQVRGACNGEFLHGRREPRFAFVGRSNVGKSSLINTLMGSRLAQVSKEPGKTRSIHTYVWKDAGIVLVDLPGYGFAKTAKDERDRWATFINEYLKADTGLREAVVLLDSRNGPTAIDEEAIRFLHSQKIVVRAVMTKSDQMKTQSVRALRKREVTAALALLHVTESKIHWVSSEKRDGTKALMLALMEVSRA